MAAATLGAASSAVAADIESNYDLDESSGSEDGDWCPLSPRRAGPPTEILPHSGGSCGGSSGSRADAAASAAAAAQPKHPLIEHVPRAAKTMRFIKLDWLRSLEAPYPRCQDLPEKAFGVMRAQDKLVSISHGWRFMMHPDPYGVEVEPQRALLDEVAARSQGHEVFVFLDYLAIPQRPFQLGQAERTEEEEVIFREALLHLDSVFFYADHLIHLEVEFDLPPDEGEVFTVPSMPPDSLELREIRGALQCTDPLPFHHVLMINGQPATDALTAARLLKACDSAELTMERHTFGLPNLVPCSDRGWIYLERFITMVVAAMAKEEDFDDLIFANQRHVLEEIHAGAECLRQAAAFDVLFPRGPAVSALPSVSTATSLPGGEAKAVGAEGSVQTRSSDATARSLQHVGSSRSQSRKRSSLSKVFASFEAQLQPKKFSGASVDKNLDPALRAVATVKKSCASQTSGFATSDAEIVSATMQSMVERLGTHWQAEQAQRRERPRTLQKLETYVTVWRSFTPAFMERIQRESKSDPLFLVSLPLVSVLVVLSATLLPLQRPDGGLWNNWIHMFIAAPWISFICYTFVPQWTQMVFQKQLPLRVTLLWPFIASLMTTLPIFGFAASTGIYPVPFSPLTATCSYMLALPVLWFLIPRPIRCARGARGKFMWSVIVQVSLTTVFCLGYPLLNVMLHQSHDVGHSVIMGIIFLGARVLFEKFCELASSRLGPDVMPAVVFVSETAYQVALCDFFRNIQDWRMFGMFIAVDLLENCYYLYCFFHSGSYDRRCWRSCWRRGSGTSSPMASGRRVQKSASLGSRSSANSFFCDGSRASVGSVLLLRELSDILVPIQFLVILGVLRVSPFLETNAWVAGLSEENFRRIMLYMACDLMLELLMASVTCAVLRSKGFRPLQFVRGIVVGGGFSYYCAAATTAVIWYSSLQVANNGCDFNFQFPWVEGEAVWISGLKWEALS